MINVTEVALRILKTILVAAEAGPDEGLRLLPTPDGHFALAVGKELPVDQVIEYEGFKVVLVGIEYIKSFNGKTIDYDYSSDEPVLLVR